MALQKVVNSLIFGIMGNVKIAKFYRLNFKSS